MEHREWYTVAEIAEELRVSEQTVRRWLRSGDLRGHAFGGKVGYRIRVDDWEEFLAKRAERSDR